MAESVDDVEEEPVELPRQERQDLADGQVETVERDGKVRSAWSREARRRYDEIRAGGRRTVDDDEGVGPAEEALRVKGSPGTISPG